MPAGLDINKLLNDSIRENQKEGAKAVFGLYQDLMAAGFTEAQAFELVKEMIVTGLKGGQQ